MRQRPLFDERAVDVDASLPAAISSNAEPFH